MPGPKDQYFGWNRKGTTPVRVSTPITLPYIGNIQNYMLIGYDRAEFQSNLTKIINNFSIMHHLFADDTELYSSIPNEPTAALLKLQSIEQCCCEIKNWMDNNKLKLNETKTEVFLCGPKHRRDLIPVGNLNVAGANIPFTDHVKTLGVYFDSDLSFQHQVAFLVKTCYFHLKKLGQIHPYLNKKVSNAIAVSLIHSRLDYCNSLLTGLPKCQLKRLQSVQNSAARVVTKSKKLDHITPVLHDLHWFSDL